jgi:drug/metabolite transporter (DMT)-like permease
MNLGRNKNRLAVLALITASVVSGANSPIARYGLQSIPTALFGLLRTTIPLVILGIFLLLRPRKSINKKQIATAVVFGVLIYFSANGLFYLGVQRSGSVNAAVIGLLEPLLMFLVSVEVMKEKFNARVFIGIALAFVGSIFVVFGPMLLSKNLHFAGSLVGNLLLLGCVLVSISGTWVAKLGLKNVDRVQFLFWSLVPAVVLYGSMSAGQLRLLPGILQQPLLIYAVLFGAILNGLLVYACIFYGLKRVKGEEYGLFSYITPATAAFVAVIFFGEKFTPALLLGVTIIAMGLYLAEAHRSKVWHHKFHFLVRSK